MDKKYTISLDIGTNSVGWAVLNDFSLAKKHKKIIEIGEEKRRKIKQSTNLWGAYIFEEAQTALDRRSKRAMRRRIYRRRNRLNELQRIFENEIASFDPGFFHRLEESFLQNEDREKGTKQEYPLFGGIKSPDGESYSSEKEYYEKYPTIYHLRESLMNKGEKADIRLVYLALHHAIKYRGHFVNQGQDFNLSNFSIADNWVALLNTFNELRAFDVYLDDKAEDADKILQNRSWSKSKKAFELSRLYSNLDIEQNYNTHEKGSDKETKAF